MKTLEIKNEWLKITKKIEEGSIVMKEMKQMNNSIKEAYKDI